MCIVEAVRDRRLSASRAPWDRKRPCIVLTAERALTGAERLLSRRPVGHELDANRAAVALALEDQTRSDPFRRALRIRLNAARRSGIFLWGKRVSPDAATHHLDPAIGICQNLPGRALASVFAPNGGENERDAFFKFVEARVLPLLPRLQRFRRNEWAQPPPGLRRGARPRQPDQGQRRDLADCRAQAAQQHQRARGLRRKHRRSHGSGWQGAGRRRHWGRVRN
jgi:hypothetical protein